MKVNTTARPASMGSRHVDDVQGRASEFISSFTIPASAASGSVNDTAKALLMCDLPTGACKVG